MCWQCNRSVWAEPTSLPCQSPMCLRPGGDAYTIVLSALNQQNFANTVGVAVNAATVLSDVLGVVERAGNALYLAWGIRSARLV